MDLTDHDSWTTSELKSGVKKEVSVIQMNVNELIADYQKEAIKPMLRGCHLTLSQFGWNQFLMIFSGSG